MRPIDLWFSKLVQGRTGWRPREVFSFNGGWEDCLHIDPPVEGFDHEKTDIRRLLHHAVLTNDARVTFDLPGFAAWSMSREEEHCNQNWARNKRFSFEHSLAAKDNVAQRPYVDILIERFCEEVIRLRHSKGYRTPPIKRPWPKNKKAAVCFSHDVDLIDGHTALWARRAFWRLKRFQSMLTGNRTAARDLIGRLSRWKKGTVDPVWSVPRWIEYETKYNIRSTFYFLALSTNLSLEGRRYHSSHPRLIEAARLLADAGFEIGLHAGSRSAGSLRKLCLQRSRLQKACGTPIDSVRYHYLNVRYPDSWELMTEAGFSTSSNVGWSAGCDGYRGGTCWPYRPAALPGIDFNSRIVEMPFAMMDRPRLENVEKYVEQADRMICETKKVGGVFIVDFHTDYWDEIEAPGVNRAYRKIVEKVSEDSELWVASLGEIASEFSSVSPTDELCQNGFEEKMNHELTAIPVC